MNKFLTLKNINDWVHNYDYINNIYNELPHRGIKNYSPNEVFNNDDLINNIKNNIKNDDQNKYFEVGDYVRIRNKKSIFEKEGQNFSKNVYMIVDKNKNKYKLQDIINNNILKKDYNYNQLLK